MNFVKFLRTTFLIEHLWWLLLEAQCSYFAIIFYDTFLPVLPVTRRMNIFPNGNNSLLKEYKVIYDNETFDCNLHKR